MSSTSEQVKEIVPFPDIVMGASTSATPGTKTTIFPARSRGGFRINTPEATSDILVYYVDYPGGDSTPFYVIPPKSTSGWDNLVSRDGVPRGYMGEVQVSSTGASEAISIVEYKPGS